MSIKQSFLMAMKSLVSSKMRSILTMLGIIIGVAAVIVIISMGNGLVSEVEEMFESMGTNLINVNITGRGGNRSVSVDDVMELYEENTDVISHISPTVNATIVIKNGSDNIMTSCVGTNEMYPDIKKLTIEQGRYLEYIEVENRQKVCVVGTYIANELFGTKSVVGQSIKLNGENYKIVGVLEETGDSEEGSADDIIYLPYTLASSISRMRTINSYAVSAASEDKIDAAVELLENFLLTVYSSDDYFNVTSQQAIVDEMDEMMGMIISILAGIAAISLLVGGIGIMNIMLVSVTERTREIGIRKSLGATPWDIMSQFVVEAGTTSGCGGILGIIFGCILAVVAGKILDMTVSPSVGAITIAFSVSVGIGIIFGYFPAKKASKLSPIEALRYD